MTANVNAPAPPPGEVERLTTLLEQWHWEQLGPSATRFPWSGRPLAEWLLSHGLTVARDAPSAREPFKPGESDDDCRYGVLPYGIIPATRRPTP